MYHAFPHNFNWHSGWLVYFLTKNFSTTYIAETELIVWTKFCFKLCFKYWHLQASLFVLLLMLVCFLSALFTDYMELDCYNCCLYVDYLTMLCNVQFYQNMWMWFFDRLYLFSVDNQMKGQSIFDWSLWIITWWSNGANQTYAHQRLSRIHFPAEHVPMCYCGDLATWVSNLVCGWTGAWVVKLTSY